MAKIPYIQFYGADHLKDTRILPLNVQGGWMILLLYMWENDPKGELIGTMDDFTRLMSCSPEEAILIIQTLKEKKIFAWEELENGKLRIISRKQKKMVKLSEIRQKSGKNGGNPKLVSKSEGSATVLLNQKNNLVKQNTNQNPEYEYEYKDRIEDDVGGLEGEEGEREGFGSGTPREPPGDAPAGWNQFPGSAERSLELPEIKAICALELLLLNGTKAEKQHIEKLWYVFKNQYFNSKKFYCDPDEVYTHFINWSKSQKINGHGESKLTTNGKSAGAVELANKLAEKLAARGNADYPS